MSGKAEQTTIQPASKTPAGMIPTVMYDSVNKVIIVEVVVAQPPGAGEILISAPPVTIPTGTWTVSWELMVSTSGLIANFTRDGIILPRALPPGVTRMAIPSGSESRWAAQFKNEVVNVESFQYEIGIDSVSSTGKQRGAIHVTTYHDPTIAVVRDPVDPPPPSTTNRIK